MKKRKTVLWIGVAAALFVSVWGIYGLIAYLSESGEDLAPDSYILPMLAIALVVLSLGLFLNLRVAWWVAIGIPISFAGMFILAGMFGITINVISLFGMILVVGMLVDDAIVVAENVYQKYEKGDSPFQAAFRGTTQVMAPVFTAVITTMLAFTPFFFFALAIINLQNSFSFL